MSRPRIRPVLVVGGALFALSLLGFRHGPADDGETLFKSYCVACHQAGGQGLAGVFPPLAASPWVTGDRGRLARIVLQGLSGPVTVNDVTFNGAMPPWGETLDDDQIAAVLTYIRSAWGNEADAVPPADVAAVRAATADRTTPWTAEELDRPENQGIPGSDQ